MIRVLSMGGGVNTVALLLKYWERYTNPGDYVGFADTGDEMPETYEYMEKYVKPFCKEKGIEFVTVKHNTEPSMYGAFYDRKMIPLRSQRECTIQFKIKPIQREMRRRGASKRNPYLVAIGFAYDEAWRMSNQAKHEQTYEKKEYPLIEDKITRQGCFDIIKDYGWEEPVRSACYYCPFKKPSEFKKMYRKHPDLFQKSVEFEQNNKLYPKVTLSRKPLLNLVNDTSLDGFLPEQEDDDFCDDGYCMR